MIKAKLITREVEATEYQLLRDNLLGRGPDETTEEYCDRIWSIYGSTRDFDEEVFPKAVRMVIHRLLNDNSSREEIIDITLKVGKVLHQDPRHGTPPFDVIFVKEAKLITLEQWFDITSDVLEEMEYSSFEELERYYRETDTPFPDGYVEKHKPAPKRVKPKTK